MTKRDKRIKKWRNNPLGVRFEELATFLEEHGYTRRKSKGSHQIFKKPGKEPLTIATHGGEVNRNAVLQAIDAVESDLPSD